MIKWLICTKLYHQVAYQFQILPPQRHLLPIIESSWKGDDDKLLSQVKDGEQALAVKNMILSVSWKVVLCINTALNHRRTSVDHSL